jgi:hypothetical protein
MSETAWWVIVGVALAAVVIGAMRFDLMGLMLRDKLEHPEESALSPDAMTGGHAEPAPEQHGAPAHAHPAGRRKPPYHRSGRRA